MVTKTSSDAQMCKDGNVVKSRKQVLKAIRLGGLDRERALEAIFKENRGYVFATLRSKGVPDADLRGCYSQAMTELYLCVSADKYRDEGEFRTFLVTVGYRVWLKGIAEYNRQQRLRDHLQAFLWQLENDEDALQAVCEMEDALRSIIQQLSPKERELVEMKWFDRAPYEAIAAAFGYESEQVARNLACRALRKLCKLALAHPQLKGYAQRFVREPAEGEQDENKPNRKVGRK
jgi:RNA polymerase sigma factor (sigma-70 family)